MNPLIEQMMGQLAQQQAGKLGAKLGMDDRQAAAAMKVAMPAIMAAMARNSASQDGAQSLNKALEKDHDGSLLDSLDDFVGRGDTTPGDAILKHVFGGQRGAVEQAAASEAGVKSDQMQKMMGMLAPVIMAQLGKQKRSGGFDAGDLIGMIGGASGGRESTAGGGLSGIAGQILGGALGGGAQAAPTGMSGIASQILGRLGDRQFQSIGKQLGLSPSATRGLVQMALPMILAALARNASKGKGAEELYGALERDHNGGLMESDDFILDSDPTEGDEILEHVFGPQRGAIERGVAEKAGLDKGAIGKIFSILAPVVLGELGRRRVQQGLSPQDIARELQTERAQYGAPAPRQTRRAAKRAPAQASSVGDLIGSLIDQDGDGDAKDDAMRMGAGILGRILRGRKS